MNKDARIYVAGHRGMVGGAIHRVLAAQGYENLITRTHAELDLTDQAATEAFFAAERPEYVFLAAAKVGGILANDSYPAEFIQRNLAIQTNVIHAAWRHAAARLLFLGSSCIYPKDCPQPIREEYLLTGPLEPTNRPYAVAKISGIEMCWSYNRQYGTRYLAAMPTNLYGLGDNYDLETSHVVPALIRKCHEAKQRGAGEVMVWGTGTPRREFLYTDDLAEACVFLMNLEDARFDALTAAAVTPLINVGSGSDVTIAEMAEMVARAVGFTGQLVYDHGRPDGTPRKLMDSSRLNALGWRPRVGLDEGLKRTYREFLQRLGDKPGISA